MNIKTHLLLALLPAISTAAIPSGVACAALAEAAAVLLHPNDEDDDPGDAPNDDAAAAPA